MRERHPRGLVRPRPSRVRSTVHEPRTHPVCERLELRDRLHRTGSQETSYSAHGMWLSMARPTVAESIRAQPCRRPRRMPRSGSPAAHPPAFRPSSALAVRVTSCSIRVIPLDPVARAAGEGSARPLEPVQDVQDPSGERIGVPRPNDHASIPDDYRGVARIADDARHAAGHRLAHDVREALAGIGRQDRDIESAVHRARRPGVADPCQPRREAQLRREPLEPFSIHGRPVADANEAKLGAGLPHHREGTQQRRMTLDRVEARDHPDELCVGRNSPRRAHLRAPLTVGPKQIAVNSVGDHDDPATPEAGRDGVPLRGRGVGHDGVGER